MPHLLRKIVDIVNKRMAIKGSRTSIRGRGYVKNLKFKRITSHKGYLPHRKQCNDKQGGKSQKLSGGDRKGTPSKNPALKVHGNLK